MPRPFRAEQHFPTPKNINSLKLKLIYWGSKIELVMKIFGPKSVSTWLSNGMAITSLLFFVFLIYILGSLALGNYILVSGIFHIQIPLTSSEVQGELTFKVITTIIFTLLYYMVFLFLVSRILKGLEMPSPFNKKTIKNLRYFMLMNLLVFPLGFAGLNFIFSKTHGLNYIPQLLLHLLLGLFSFFLIELFKRGFTLQSDHDLTI
ncbi:MAG: DUF2975 domain-containing protein [Flavobacteriaceae bacterium]